VVLYMTMYERKRNGEYVRAIIKTKILGKGRMRRREFKACVESNAGFDGLSFVPSRL
jgi:hypothetical protein